MNPIIEKVARAIDPDAWRHFDYFNTGNNNSHEGNLALVQSMSRASAAIRATLEHMKENISDEMVLATRKEMGAEPVPFNLRMEFAIKAALSQALAELDA